MSTLPQHHDPHRAARGVCTGIALGLIAWAVAIALAWGHWPS